MQILKPEFRGNMVADFFRSKHLALGFCKTWFLGYQSYSDLCGYWVFQIFVIPAVCITLRWRVI